MKTNPPSAIHIVRIIDKDSDPMVGYTCPIGKAGMICWDTECRKFNPHTEVLVDKKTHNIIKVNNERI